MPAVTTDNSYEMSLKQLIPPKPQPIRGKPFQLSGNEEWFIYPHGKSVYLYNMHDNALSREYREHAYPVGVARLSPSKRFIASGDQCGILRIWSINGDENKDSEFKVLGGAINDIAWSEDEKYIAVCGEGRDQFANVIKVDGGAAFGELTGPTKSCTSIALTSTHCILSSDDKSVTIYRASPTFKFVKTFRDHDNFVQVARFSADGKKFATAGADGKVFTYSTETLERIGEGCKVHDAGILGLEWLDEDNLLTASADKSLKILFASSGAIKASSEVSKDWTFDKQVCGIKTNGNSTIVLRLDGSIEILSLDTLKEADSASLFCGIGHSKGIVDLMETKEGSLKSLSYDGNLKTWTFKNGSLNLIEESAQLKNASKLFKDDGSVIFENKLLFKETSIDYPAKIVGYSADFLILSNGSIYNSKQKQQQEVINDLKMEIDLATFKKNDTLLAVSQGNSLKIYNQINGVFNVIESFDNLPGKITAMEFNESGNSLAVADDQRRIKIYTKSESSWMKQSCQWCNHAARIDTLIWIDEEVVVSAGVDGHIMAWCLALNKISPIKVVKGAHSAPINKLIKFKGGEGEEGGYFISGASDSCIKLWKY